MIWILSFSNYIPSGPLSPSSHEMRDDPFLGQYTRKSQNIRRRGDEVWKVVSMTGNGMMTCQGDLLVANPYLRVTTY
jgi:hypothetical protein